MLRIIAAEETGVDHDSANYSRQAETDDAPVKSRRASPARFPAVHTLPQIGVLVFDKDRNGCLKKILLGRKEIIVSEQHGAAKLFCSEIDQFSKVHLRFSLRDKRQRWCSRFSTAERVTSL